MDRLDFGELNAFRGRPLSSRRRNIALDEWDDEGEGRWASSKELNRERAGRLATSK